jgi:hypothetical protein
MLAEEFSESENVLLAEVREPTFSCTTRMTISQQTDSETIQNSFDVTYSIEASV